MERQSEPCRRGVARSGASQPCEQAAPLREMQPGRVLDAKVHALQSQRHCLLPEQLLQCPPRVLMLLLQGRAERPLQLPKEQPRWAALLDRKSTRLNSSHLVIS